MLGACSVALSSTHTHTRAHTHTHTHTQETCAFLAKQRELQHWDGESYITLVPECVFTHFSGPPSPLADLSQAFLALSSAHICRSSHRAKASRQLSMMFWLCSRASLEWFRGHWPLEDIQTSTPQGWRDLLAHQSSNALKQSLSNPLIQ